MRSQLLHQTRAIRRAFGVFDGDQCLGTAVLECDTQHNTHLGEVDVNVPPEHRRQGIGSLLLQQLSEVAAEVGLTALLGEINVVDRTSSGPAFTRRHGFRSVHTENRLVLDLPLSPSRLAELVQTSDAAEHGYSVTSWDSQTLVEHLAAMAQLKTGMNAEVPAGDVDADPEVITPKDLNDRDQRFQDRGYLSLISLVTAPDREPAGYSRLLVA